MQVDKLTTHFRIFLKERPAFSPTKLANELIYNNINLLEIVINV